MPLSILSKNPESQSDHEKNTRKTQIEGPSTKYRTGTPQTVKVTKTKIRLRNSHRPEEANMIAQCNVASMGSWSRNRAATGEQEKPRESPERR